jgi:hypothetical protein
MLKVGYLKVHGRGCKNIKTKNNNIEIMFNLKKDRKVVEITIEFNITAISKWLKAGAKIEEIDKIDNVWKNSITQTYMIDMLPIGDNTDAYYHRAKNIINQNISGRDTLKNIDEQTKSYIVRLAPEIKNLTWNLWRGSLCLNVWALGQDHPIFLSPSMDELVELHTKGEISNRKALGHESSKISVPISYNDDNTPREFMEIHRSSTCSQSVGYHNGLGSVSFSVLNFEVDY